MIDRIPRKQNQRKMLVEDGMTVEEFMRNFISDASQGDQLTAQWLFAASEADIWEYLDLCEQKKVFPPDKHNELTARLLLISPLLDFAKNTTKEELEEYQYLLIHEILQLLKVEPFPAGGKREDRRFHMSRLLTEAWYKVKQYKNSAKTNLPDAQPPAHHVSEDPNRDDASGALLSRLMPTAPDKTGQSGGRPNSNAHQRARARLVAGETATKVRNDWREEYYKETGQYPDETKSGENELWRKSVKEGLTEKKTHRKK